MQHPFSSLFRTLIIGAAFIVGTTLIAQDTPKAKADTQKAAPKKRAPDPAMAPIQDEPGLPRVLLIGDSISIGYTLPVRALLKGKANVHRIPTNGGPTTNGLAQLKKWIGTGKWDVIHFNWGLHDIAQVTENGPRIPIDAYEKNLRELVKQLKSTGAKLIWCATTPVPEGNLTPKRLDKDVQAYNAVAKKIMAENKIAIDDLYAFALPQLNKIQREVNVHFSTEGSAVLAKQVAASIEAALPKPAPVVPPRKGKSETLQLFNGKNLDGWVGHEKHWSVQDGVIVGKNTEPVPVSTYLLTKRTFTDFRLVATVKLVQSEMHSGISLWGRIAPERNDPYTYAGHLVMFPSGWGFWDLYGRNSILKDDGAAKRAGKQHDWNQLEILAQGNRIRLVVNGTLVADWRDPEPDRIKEGPLGLQLHSNKVPQEIHFKDLVLTTFPEDRLITLKH
ncbi:MAG: family 16 glycoside hydrolase [Verrucomicrobiota bacterium]